MEEPDTTSYCPRPVGYMSIPGVGTIPVSCRRWDCPHCGKWRQLRLAARVAAGFLSDHQTDDVIAWTLTQKHGSKQNIVKNFQKLRRLLRKRHLIGMKFLWVKEFTKRGQRHLHIITKTAIDQDYLQDLWLEVTGGESYIVWVNQTNLKNAGGYAFKYLMKAYSAECRYDPKERRYGFSKDYKFSQKYADSVSNLPVFPLMGDFWEIIGHPNCKPHKFELDTYFINLYRETNWSKMRRNNGIII